MPWAVKIYDEEGNSLGSEESPLAVTGSIENQKATAFITGQKDLDVSNTRQALVASQTLLTIGVVEVTSLPTNTEGTVIYIGDSNVTVGTGHALTNDKTTVIFIDDLSKIYAISSTGNVGVSFQAS